MSNFPTLTEEATTLLIHIEHENYIRGRGPRIPASKARNELKRHKLIYSRPLNANPLLPAAAGHGYQWCPTPFGAEVAEALAKERREQEGAEPLLSNVMRRALELKAKEGLA